MNNKENDNIGTTDSTTKTEAITSGESLLSGMSGWQPIETAPMDGTWIIAYEADPIEPEMHVVQYTSSPMYHIKNQEMWVGDYTASYDDDHLWLQNPTHWMPLPEPPKS